MKQSLQKFLLSCLLIPCFAFIAIAQQAPPPTATSKTEEIKVFPNPVIDFFYITGDEGAETIQVFSVIGKLVKTFKTDENGRYDLRDQPKGMYIIRILGTNNEFLATRRINKINP